MISLLAPQVRAITLGRQRTLRRLPVERLSKAKIGDRLWVREPWAFPAYWNDYSPTSAMAIGATPAQAIYLADGPTPAECGRARYAREMPRVLSRYVLEIIDRGAERLQDIDDDAARLEGYVGDGRHLTPRLAFAAGWDRARAAWLPSEHARDRWANNPSVVVLRFRLIVGNIDLLTAVAA